MTSKTIIDRQAIERAVSISGVELYANFQPFGDDQTCFAVICESESELRQFLIEVATQDPVLATNLNDVVKDVGIGDKTHYFLGYDLEEEDDGPPPRREPDPMRQAEDRSRGISAL